MNPIDDLIAREWRAFDTVKNEGGRANCQDDFETFEIMRKSQFLSWDAATLACYHADLQRASVVGRNLIQEKYARMMASTAPEQYATFAHTLPVLTDWQKTTIERIVSQQLAWRLDFAKTHPHMSDQARVIRTSEDRAYATSFETYLRGELGTYSEPTLRAYAAMVAAYVARGDNLTTATMHHIALLYGYTDLAAAEHQLAQA